MLITGSGTGVKTRDLAVHHHHRMGCKRTNRGNGQKQVDQAGVGPSSLCNSGGKAWSAPLGCAPGPLDIGFAQGAVSEQQATFFEYICLLSQVEKSVYR